MVIAWYQFIESVVLYIADLLQPFLDALLAKALTEHVIFLARWHLQHVEMKPSIPLFGGGSIACVEKSGQLHGIAAVIDKDLSASLLAIALHADRFIILTDVDGVYQHWQRRQQQKITQISATTLAKLTFATGSMRTKITAACEFIKKLNALPLSAN